MPGVSRGNRSLCRTPPAPWGRAAGKTGWQHLFRFRRLVPRQPGQFAGNFPPIVADYRFA